MWRANGEHRGQRRCWSHILHHVEFPQVPCSDLVNMLSQGKMLVFSDMFSKLINSNGGLVSWKWALLLRLCKEARDADSLLRSCILLIGAVKMSPVLKHVPRKVQLWERPSPLLFSFIFELYHHFYTPFSEAAWCGVQMGRTFPILEALPSWLRMKFILGKRQNINCFAM